MRKSVSQSVCQTGQSVSQSVSLSVSRAVCQSVSQLISDSFSLRVRSFIGLSSNQLVTHSERSQISQLALVRRSDSSSVCSFPFRPCVRPSVRSPVSQSVCRSVCLSVSRSVGQSVCPPKINEFRLLSI